MPGDEGDVHGSGPRSKLSSGRPIWRARAARKMPGSVSSGLSGYDSKLDVSPGVDVWGMMGACMPKSHEQQHSRLRNSGTHANRLALDEVPVDALEPAVVLDVRRTVLEVPKALREIRGEKPPDEVLGDKVDVRREGELARQDLLVDLERRVGEEWWVPGEEFEEEHAERPEVGRFAVPGCGNLLGRQVSGSGRRQRENGTYDFGREVFGCAAERVRAVRDVLCEANCGAPSSA